MFRDSDPDNSVGTGQTPAPERYPVQGDKFFTNTRWLRSYTFGDDPDKMYGKSRSHRRMFFCPTAGIVTRYKHFGPRLEKQRPGGKAIWMN
jgi:hypothetical protein